MRQSLIRKEVADAMTCIPGAAALRSISTKAFNEASAKLTTSLQHQGHNAVLPRFRTPVR